MIADLRRMTGRIAPAVFVGTVLLFLLAPIILVVLFSFNASPRLSFPIDALTLDWYAAVFSDPAFVRALRNSAVAAASVALLALLLGVPFSFGIMHLKGRTRAGALGASLVPAIVPGLLLGIALTVFFTGLGIQLNLRTAIVGHLLVALPFVVLIMYARLERLDPDAIEAARDLGASPATAFRDVTLPLILPSMIGAAMLAMAISLDEFIITFFASGSDQTLPVMIWTMLRLGIDPRINAIATLILLGSLALAVTANRRASVRL